MEMSWELLVLVWCLLVGNPCARVSPPTCSSQHLLCTWCLPSNRGGREWVWIHQGGSYDLPGIPDTGQPDWRFNCVLERVPLGYNCTIKMFPDPKGKWQGISRIWTEEISIPKLAAVKSSRLCCPLHHSRAENRPNFLWKFYKLQYVYNSKPVLKPFSLLIYIYILDLKFRSRSFIHLYSSCPSLFILQSFWDNRLWHSWASYAKKHSYYRSTQLYCQKRLWGCKNYGGNIGTALWAGEWLWHWPSEPCTWLPT